MTGLCGGSQFWVPGGEEVLPKDTFPLVKASVGARLGRTCPFFRIADMYVGETTCDAKKKAYEILGEDVPMYVMDVPQMKRAKDILEQNKEGHHALAQLLIEREVIFAEDVENIPKVKAVNADGTRNIANVCKKLGCKMIYISTDYVFNGQGTEPWTPDCMDYAPLNVYGQTKLDGELAVSETLDKFFIVRIAWVFGLNGKNFVKTMLSVGRF